MIIHVVESGDTLDSIANTYQVSSARLIQDNGLENCNNLVIGQAIVIVHADKTYTVQEGDTLIGIAEKNGITLIQLLRNNPSLSQHFYVGDILIISYSVEKKGKISTNGYVFPFIKNDILRKTLPFLTYLTIYEYKVTCEGEINNIDDEEIIKITKEYGVAPLMLITPFIDGGSSGTDVDLRMLSNKEAQERFINNVLDILDKKGYYGLNISIQHFTLENKILVEEFLQTLSNQLKSEGYPMFITLTPQTVLDESYQNINYSILGQAASGVLLLSYEWGYSYGPPAAVTSVSLVRQYLDFIVTQIPSKKLHIGIPVIAYNWETPYTPGVSRGNALSIDTALRLAVENNSTIYFDESAQAPYFYYHRGDPGADSTNLVWFKDARSIDTLTSLVPEYELAGIAVWNIMSFFAQLWLIINSQYEIETIYD